MKDDDYIFIYMWTTDYKRNDDDDMNDGKKGFDDERLHDDGDDHNEVGVEREWRGCVVLCYTQIKEKKYRNIKIWTLKENNISHKVSLGLGSTSNLIYLSVFIVIVVSIHISTLFIFIFGFYIWKKKKKTRDTETNVVPHSFIVYHTTESETRLRMTLV